MTVDSNTGNKIKNHHLQGFITENHIHLLVTYEEVLPEGKIDHRRNSLHYYFTSQKESYLLVDVYLNSELLVFANTNLLRID